MTSPHLAANPAPSLQVSLPVLMIALRIGLLASAAVACFALGRASGVGASAALV